MSFPPCAARSAGPAVRAASRLASGSGAATAPPEPPLLCRSRPSEKRRVRSQTGAPCRRSCGAPDMLRSREQTGILADRHSSAASNLLSPPRRTAARTDGPGAAKSSQRLGEGSCLRRFSASTHGRRWSGQPGTRSSQQPTRRRCARDAIAHISLVYDRPWRGCPPTLQQGRSAPEGKALAENPPAALAEKAPVALNEKIPAAPEVRVRRRTTARGKALSRGKSHVFDPAEAWIEP